MSFGIWEASVPLFVNSLTDMRDWLGKAAAEKSEAALLEARLAPELIISHISPYWFAIYQMGSKTVSGSQFVRQSDKGSNSHAHLSGCSGRIAGSGNGASFRGAARC